MPRFRCPKCSNFAGPSFRSVYRHIAKEHALEPDFIIKCGIDECQATHRNMSSWSKHIYRHHKKLDVGLSIVMYICIISSSFS